MATARVVRIPVYWLIVGVATSAVTPVLSTIASVRIAENNAERVIASQRRADEQNREDQRRQFCRLFGALLDATDEAPSHSQTAENVRGAYLYYYNVVGQCTPKRK